MRNISDRLQLFSAIKVSVWVYPYPRIEELSNCNVSHSNCSLSTSPPPSIPRPSQFLRVIARGRTRKKLVTWISGASDSRVMWTGWVMRATCEGGIRKYFYWTPQKISPPAKKRGLNSQFFRLCRAFIISLCFYLATIVRRRWKFSFFHIKKFQGDFWGGGDQETINFGNPNFSGGAPPSWYFVGPSLITNSSTYQ